MILVDKDIIDRSKEIFINGYDEENVKPISYDIHIAEVITEHGNVDEYDLKPQQAIMVKCVEEISVPTDLLIRVENKNSFGRKSTNVHPTETYITTSKGGAVVEIPANSLNILRLK